MYARAAYPAHAHTIGFRQRTMVCLSPTTITPAPKTSTTLTWLGHNRRMRKDYERLAKTSEAFIYIAMTP